MVDLTHNYSAPCLTPLEPSLRASPSPLPVSPRSLARPYEVQSPVFFAPVNTRWRRRGFPDDTRFCRFPSSALSERTCAAEHWTSPANSFRPWFRRCRARTAESATCARSVEGAVSVSMAEAAAIARSVETTAAANATVPLLPPKYSRGISKTKSAPPATGTEAQSEREQKRTRRPYMDQSAPAIRRRKKEMQMMTFPLRLRSSMIVLLW